MTTAKLELTPESYLNATRGALILLKGIQDTWTGNYKLISHCAWLPVIGSLFHRM